jgi:hypothetical protein
MINLRKTGNKQKHKKLKVALLSPLLIITFIIGWSLYWIGQTRHTQPQKPRNNNAKKINEIELIVIPLQEQTTQIY